MSRMTRAADSCLARALSQGVDKAGSVQGEIMHRISNLRLSGMADQAVLCGALFAETQEPAPDRISRICPRSQRRRIMYIVAGHAGDAARAAPPARFIIDRQRQGGNRFRGRQRQGV